MNARALLLLLALASGLCGCGVSDACVVPGVVAQCSCPGAVPGARVCLPNRRWAGCDCSARIALPNAPAAGASPDTAGAGGARPTDTAPASGRAATAPAMTTPPEADAGVLMTRPATPDAAVVVDAGAPPASDASVDAHVDAGTPEPRDPYRSCQGDADCDPNGLCVQTQSVPDVLSVCAPPCMVDSDCPVPAGSYQARVSCLLGHCGLDCTPILFDPLLSCPEGMICISDPFNGALCHAAGD